MCLISPRVIKNVAFDLVSRVYFNSWKRHLSVVANLIKCIHQFQIINTGQERPSNQHAGGAHP
jgi:hypothetical protein